MTNYRKPAFPETTDTRYDPEQPSHEPGMSRQLWVATHVLKGLLSVPDALSRDVHNNVQLAWEYAEAMMEEEQKRIT